MNMTSDFSYDEEAPRARVALLLQDFSRLGDDREPWRIAYRLAEVLLLPTRATIASCDDFDDIVRWGEDHLDFLRRFAPFHHGIPGERWLRALVNRGDPLTFGRCFEDWIQALWPGQHDLVAIDGKTSRRTGDERNGLKALHTLSAYATNAHLTLAQLSVPEKTNKIAAIPVLLDQLAEKGHLEGGLVTIDGKGCQVEIAAEIVAHGADFLLPLKGNQQTMEAEVAAYFVTAPKEELVTKTTVDKGHGRIETRQYAASKTVDWIVGDRSYPGKPRFQGIQTILSVVNKTEYADRCTFDERLYISSAPLNIERLAAGARGHWGWRAWIGCSTSSSRTISRAIAPATAPRTWPSFSASPSASCAPTNPAEASKPEEKSQLEYRLSLATPAKEMTVNLVSQPWVNCR